MDEDFYIEDSNPKKSYALNYYFSFNNWDFNWFVLFPSL